MAFFKTYKRELLIFGALILLYLFTRLYNILSLPIFTDEAIYIRWSQIARQDPNWRFISLTDGKQPMFVWIAMILMRFITDPLLAGRFVSVIAGLGTTIGMFFLGRELFKNKWIGLLCSFLYVIYPMALVYDRLALYDSLVGMFTVWSLFVQVKMVQTLQLHYAFIAALVIGGGMLTKTNAFSSIYFFPITLLLLTLKPKERLQTFFRWATLGAIMAGIAYLYYSVLRLSPFFRIIDEKNALFVFPIKEWIEHPLRFFWGNLYVGEWNWLQVYVTWPVLILIVLSFFIEKKFYREKVMLLLWFIVPFLLLALFGKVLYPRFIFYMTLYLLPLVAFSLFYLHQKIHSKNLYKIIVVVSFSLFFATDFFILTDIQKAAIPDSDRNQYVSDWPSGGGIRESVKFFTEESAKGKIHVATQGTFGLLPNAYEIYLDKNTNISLQGIWPIDIDPPIELLQISNKMPTYVVFYQPCHICEGPGIAPKSWPVKLLYRFEKPGGNRFLSVYQLNP